MKLEEIGDPEIATRIAQYEMAFRMQTSVPELTDLSNEPEQIFELYGPDSRKPGTFAANCLLARRLAERGVRFIQLFHRGWDHHGDLPQADLPKPVPARPTSRRRRWSQDLKQRGMLDDTLVVWGGEFGRTVYCQGASPRTTTAATIIRAASRCGWRAAASSPASRYGETDDSATTSPTTRCTSTISTRRSCTAWASITRS